MSQKATILQEAAFNPKIKNYLMWTGCLILLATIAGIVLIPFWIVFGSFYLKRYFERLECELTTRSLRFKKGYIFHTERTIPLDKIQDLTFKEGPLLKYFGLSILRIETAGSSGQGTPDLSLIGIVEASEFRQKVLDQRDIVTDKQSPTPADTSTSDESIVSILSEIRDTLGKIEEKLNAE